MERSSDCDTGARPVAECAEFARAVSAFASSAEPLDVGLRTHAAACPSCAALYRDLIEAAAQRARSMRGSACVDSARSISTSTPMRVPKRIVLPLLAVVLAALAALPTRPIARVRVLEGEAQVGAARLARDSDALEARSNVSISTADDSRAQVEHGDTRVVFEASTGAALESGATLALRLFGGELSVDGDARVVTALGVVECAQGRARITLDGDRLDVESMSGRVALATAASSRELCAGERSSVVLRAGEDLVSSRAR